MSNYKNDDSRLRLLAKGDERDWQLFYEDLRSPFRLYFLKHTGLNDDAVTELYQDSMVVMHRKITRGDLLPPLRATLQTYLLGVGKMLYRKQQSSPVKWDDDIPDQPIPPGIERAIADRELAGWLRQLLNQLDAKCRDLLEKVYLREFAMEALAEELDISAGAVRKRKFDCLQRLRSRVQV